MEKIKNIIFKVLKTISYLWIIIFSIAMFSLSFTDGQYHLGQRILLLIIMNIVPAVFIMWRFKADKEIRLQKQKNKLEKKKEELQVRKELKEIEEIEEVEKVEKEQNKDQIKNNYNKTKKNVYIKVVGLILIFCLIIGAFGLNPKRKAISMAKNQVESALKAPGTAKFGGIKVQKLDKDPGKIYIVNGYVDSENGFGALIRTNFKVSISKDNRGYNIYDFTTN